MTDGPEEIWASCKTPLAQKKSGDWHEYPYGTEYIRKDLSDAAIAELVEGLRELMALQRVKTGKVQRQASALIAKYGDKT